MAIDPKTALWLNLIYTVLISISAPALQAAGIADASKIAAIAALLAMPLNVVLHAYSSTAAGPLVKGDK